MKCITSVGRLGRVLVVLIVVALALSSDGWTASKYKTLYVFNNDSGGRLPTAGLVFDRTGNLYGTTRFADYGNPGAVFELKPNSKGGWAESLLYVFNGNDGSLPYAGLTVDKAGNLYGTTSQGGANNAGTAFRLTLRRDGSWTESALYSFCALSNCNDGSYPLAGLILDQAGNVYGTTSQGGDSGNPCGNYYGSCGTVFKLTPTKDGGWAESVLYRFCSLTNCGDGLYPLAGLIFDQAGNLYGTTSAGGANGGGTVFKLTPTVDGGWTENVLYSFCPVYSCSDGLSPVAGLIFDTSGTLYGTTNYGGDAMCNEGQGPGCGTVFKLTPSHDGSWAESVLHSFGGGGGAYPLAGLVFDATGSLYGTTIYGGDFNKCPSLGCGVVFKLTHDRGEWKETVLHAFFDDPGAFPYGGVTFDSFGNLYGTTFGEGGGDRPTYGSVFKIAP
jgi:uncharacterized repeat protein (TIGR03803 family)